MSRKSATDYEVLETPVFKTEAEEADWWFANQDLVLDMFKKAEKNGTLGVGTVAKRGTIPTTTIRLDPADIALAKQQAEERGLKYQTYLKSVIHQALKREARRKTAAA